MTPRECARVRKEALRLRELRERISQGRYDEERDEEYALLRQLREETHIARTKLGIKGGPRFRLSDPKVTNALELNAKAVNKNGKFVLGADQKRKQAAVQEAEKLRAQGAKSESEISEALDKSAERGLLMAALAGHFVCED